jgi:hypothetical protein
MAVKRRYPYERSVQMDEKTSLVIKWLADVTDVSASMIMREAMIAGLPQHPLYEQAVREVQAELDELGDRGMERVKNLLAL